MYVAISAAVADESTRRGCSATHSPSQIMRGFKGASTGEMVSNTLVLRVDNMLTEREWKIILKSIFLKFIFSYAIVNGF